MLRKGWLCYLREIEVSPLVGKWVWKPQAWSEILPVPPEQRCGLVTGNLYLRFKTRLEPAWQY